MIKMRCKSCSKVVGVHSSMCGKQVKCPHCGSVSRVPHLKVAQSLEAPAVAEKPAGPQAVRAAGAEDPSAELPPVTDVPRIQVDVEGGATSQRLARRKPKTEGTSKRTLLMIGGALVVAGILGVFIYAALDTKPDTQVAAGPEPDDRPATEAEGLSETDGAPPPEADAAELLPDEADDEQIDAEASDERPGGTDDPPPPHAEQPIDEQPAEPVDNPLPMEPEETFALPEPTADAEPPTEEPAPLDAPSVLPPMESLPTLDATGLTDADKDRLVELHANRSLYSVKEYPTLRRMFAERFARSHAAEIRAAWAPDDDAAMRQWLEENRVIKEELFLAIDPEVDDVSRVLQICKALKDAFPEKIVPYANLAIAIAVTWDTPQAIYNYEHHARRAKAVMPEDLLDEIATFDYFVKAESIMQGRAQWFPWEFLVHVVNHRTPLEERAWAVQNYLPQRVMFGRCYQDVPYDMTMLDSGSQKARLNGQRYTLANLRQYGGVCAMQADFASRVGQSLGVPAAYVGGESAYGDSHAWVMWVEVKSVTPKSIGFTLESHGRYRGDRYYVGTLRDPKSGRQITDRQLELRLHTVGIDPVAKRHADLVMAAYPALKERENLATGDRFAYLRRTIDLCPGHEQAWTALAAMAATDEVREKHRRQMTGILKQLFTTFVNFPDFTWAIFDDLIQYEDRLKERIKLYETLTQQYQMAQRPDLACEARLRLTDLLVEDGQELAAVEGLAATIFAFVDEGRYVPRMLDRIEQICQNMEGATPHLLRFYHSFLPRIPQMRGDRPSPYCMQMFERGIALLKQHGEMEAAQVYEAQLAQIRAGRGRRK